MIFVDTSAFLALADSEDRNHTAARTIHDGGIMRGKFGRMVTSDYVLDEAFTLLKTNLGVDAVEALAGVVESGGSVHQVWVGREHFRSALQLLKAHADRSWSFTDCTSFVIMRELGIAHAFSFNADFRQAGFSIAE